MPLFTPQGEKAWGYLGDIVSAAYQRFNTANLWQAVHSATARYGYTEPGITFSDVTAIRSYAVKLRNSEAAYAAADPGYAIDASMATTAIWSPQDLNGIATTPNYQVRGIVTVQKTDGTIAEQGMTWNFADNPFGQTVGDYTNTVTDVFASRVQTAPEGSGTPTGTLVSVSQISIQVF